MWTPGGHKRKPPGCLLQDADCSTPIWQRGPVARDSRRSPAEQGDVQGLGQRYVGGVVDGQVVAQLPAAGQERTLRGSPERQGSEVGQCQGHDDLEINELGRGQPLRLAAAGREDELLAALRGSRISPRRTGASSWRAWQDSGEASRILEQFVVASWDEHLLQHSRVTTRDQHRYDAIRAMTAQGHPAAVTHWLTPGRRAWQGRHAGWPACAAFGWGNATEGERS